jgi:hypothetical protein
MGWMLAIVAMVGMREKLKYVNIPAWRSEFYWHRALARLILVAKLNLVDNGHSAVEIANNLDKRFSAPAGDKLFNLFSN